jgi:hypothetical protein
MAQLTNIKYTLVQFFKTMCLFFENNSNFREEA